MGSFVFVVWRFGWTRKNVTPDTNHWRRLILRLWWRTNDARLIRR